MQEQLDEIQQLLAVNNPKNSGSLRIESDVLEPQQVSQRYATFNIRKAGILSNDSRLLMKVYASNATTALTCYGGVFGLIKNATLRMSDGTVIAQTTEANYLASIRNHFVSQEVRQKRGVVVNGCWNNYKYGTQTTGGTTYTGKLQLADLVKENNTLVQQSRYRLPATVGDAQEYTVSLRDLFPELFPFSIPLYLLEGELQLFLEFNDEYKGIKSVATDGNNANLGDVLIDTANLKFVSDHVFMGQEGMQKLAQLTMGEKGLTIPYGDYTTLQFTRTVGAAPAAGSKTSKTFQNTFSLAGVRCKHMLIHNSEATVEPNARQRLTGNYASLDSYAGLKGQSLQLQINNENYFSQPLENQEFYKELEDVFGTAMSCPYPVYTTIGSLMQQIVTTTEWLVTNTLSLMKVKRDVSSLLILFSESMPRPH